MESDRYGKKLPKQAHGSMNLGKYTSSTKKIVSSMVKLYEQIVDEQLQVRKMYVVASRVLLEKDAPKEDFVQLDLFADVEKLQAEQAQEEQEENRERSIQQAMLDIKKKFGKNAILKGMNFSEGATTIERNGQVGGHKA